MIHSDTSAGRAFSCNYWSYTRLSVFFACSDLLWPYCFVPSGTLCVCVILAAIKCIKPYYTSKANVPITYVDEGASFFFKTTVFSVLRLLPFLKTSGTRYYNLWYMHLSVYVYIYIQIHTSMSLLYRTRSIWTEQWSGWNMFTCLSSDIEEMPRKSQASHVS